MWMNTLYTSYEDYYKKGKLDPIFHTRQNSHIVITLSENGDFIKSEAKKQNILIPSTLESSSRTSNCEPHALPDKVIYVAGDFHEFTDDENLSSKNIEFFKEYKKKLNDWILNKPHPQTMAVYNYIKKKRVIKDLLQSDLLLADSNGILENIDLEKSKHRVYPILPKENGIIKIDSALITWKVIENKKTSSTWESLDLQTNWMNYYLEKITDEKPKGICYITGKKTVIAKNHPSRIRSSDDKTKLISSNDYNGFTYRGRFELGEQVNSVGVEVSEKAHTMLRYLFKRKDFDIHGGAQTTLSWSNKYIEIPNFTSSTSTIFNDVKYDFEDTLKKLHTLNNNEFINILQTNNPSRNKKGRLAITKTERILSRDLNKKLSDWHKNLATHQIYLDEDKGLIKKLETPSISDMCFIISKTKYISKTGTSYLENIYSNLISCMLNNHKIPDHFIKEALQFVSDPFNFEASIIHKQKLGIAMSLYLSKIKRENIKNSDDFILGKIFYFYEKGSYLKTPEKDKYNKADNLERNRSFFDFFVAKNDRCLISLGSEILKKSELETLNTREDLDEAYSFLSTTKKDLKIQNLGDALLGYHTAMTDKIPKKP